MSVVIRSHPSFRFRQSMLNKLIIIAALLFLLSVFLNLQAKSDIVRIYLKIFAKSDSLVFENPEGLYLGEHATQAFRKLDINKSDTILEYNGKSHSVLSIIPKGKSVTSITTKYGTKLFNGSFIIRIRKKSFFIINQTSMNSYLQGVVGSELGESFSPETLKAQAVVSRSYFIALKKNSDERDYDAIDVAGQFQAYRGLQYVGPRVRQAVMDTNCEIIKTSSNDFIPQFHSTCGGMLLTSEESWGKEEIHERSGFRRFDGPEKSPNCQLSPYFEWSADLEKSKILKSLSNQMNLSFDDIDFLFNTTGFLKQVKLSTSDGKAIYLSGYKFKSYLEKEGIPSIRSTRFTVRADRGRLHFKGKGFGHFVGMCQWGAEFLARNKMEYRDILRYYYPGASVVYFNDCR